METNKKLLTQWSDELQAFADANKKAGRTFLSLGEWKRFKAEITGSEYVPGPHDDTIGWAIDPETGWVKGDTHE